MPWAKNGSRCPKCHAPISRVIRICKVKINGRVNFFYVENRKVRVRNNKETMLGCRFCAQVMPGGNNCFLDISGKAAVLAKKGIKLIQDMRNAAIIGADLSVEDIFALAYLVYENGNYPFDNFFFRLVIKINEREENNSKKKLAPLVEEI